MTPERIAEINALAKGDPWATGRELVKAVNEVEAERDEARAAAGRLVANIEMWVGFGAIGSMDVREFPQWLIAAGAATGPGRIKAADGGDPR